MIKVSIITLSDKGSQGEREDTSGPVIAEMIKSIGAEVVNYEILPDEKDILREKLTRLCSSSDIIFTTGGTGLTPRDITPETTLEVIERQVPGIAEAMRLEGLKKTPHAMLSRAVAGIRGKTLIINLPGSPKAVRESLEAILKALPHGVEKIKDNSEECAQT
jgi:molybdopterin adenylyltransferase